MKLKNIVKLQNGYRAGFDITDSDYVTKKTLFGQNTFLSISKIELRIKIMDLLSSEIDMSDKEIEITDIKHDIYRGYAYFNINKKGTYMNYIKEKYDID